MTRQEYLAELDANLVSLSNEEREMAVKFYEEYFEDAGVENEQSVMEDLGKPFALAKSIISEESAYSKSISYAKYRESKSIAVSSPFVAGGSADVTPDVMPGSVPDADIMPGSVHKDEVKPTNSPEQQTPPHTQYTAYNYTYSNPSSSQNNGQNEQTSQNTASESRFEYNGAADRIPHAGESGSYDEYKQGKTSAATEAPAPSYSSTSNENDTIILIIGIIVFIAILPIIFTLLAGFASCGVGAVGCLVGTIGSLIAAIPSFAIAPLSGIACIGLSVCCLGMTFIFTAITILGFGKFTPWVIKTFIAFIKKHSGGVK